MTTDYKAMLDSVSNKLEPPVKNEVCTHVFVDTTTPDGIILTCLMCDATPKHGEN